MHSSSTPTRAGTREELALPKDLPVNVFIFTGRPHLEHTITGIITAIHSGDGLPETRGDGCGTRKDCNCSVPEEDENSIMSCREDPRQDKNEMIEYAVEETQKAVAVVARKSQADLDYESDRTAGTGPLDVSDVEMAPSRSNSDGVTKLAPEGSKLARS